MISPFIMYCKATLPTTFGDELSYYETLTALTNFLNNQVIPLVNENDGKVAELTTLVNNLQNYVENYFNNLDVQEEINNKLDEMVTSGQLESLLFNFFKINVVFNTVAEMKKDVNLQAGQKVSTLGYYAANDGGGAQYIVRIQQSNDKYYETLSNNLYAELITNNIINIKTIGVKNDFFIFDTPTHPYYEEYPSNYTINTDYSDNSILINNIINLYSQNGGATLFFPQGYYGFKNQITLLKGIKLEGLTREDTFLCTNHINNDFISFTSSGVCEIDNISIIYMNNNNGNAIYINPTGGAYPLYSRMHVQNVIILNAGQNGIYNVKGSISLFNNINFSRCKNYGLYHTGSDTTYTKIYCFECVNGGIYLAGGNNKLSEVKLYYCGDYNTPQSISDISGNYSLVVGGSRNIVSQCDIQDNYKNGVYLAGVDNTISETIIDACGITSKYQNYTDDIFESYAIVVSGTGLTVNSCKASNYLFNTAIQPKFAYIDNIEYGICEFDFIKTGYENHINGELEFANNDLINRIYNYNRKLTINQKYLIFSSPFTFNTNETQLQIPNTFKGTYFNVNNNLIYAKHKKYYTLTFSFILNTITNADRFDFYIYLNNILVYQIPDYTYTNGNNYSYSFGLEMSAGDNIKITAKSNNTTITLPPYLYTLHIA